MMAVSQKVALPVAVFASILVASYPLKLFLEGWYYIMGLAVIGALTSVLVRALFVRLKQRGVKS